MKFDWLRVFPSVRRWDSYPEEVGAVTSPPDFEMSRTEEKLLDLAMQIDHRINHIRQEICYRLFRLCYSLADKVLPEYPCECGR